MRSARSELATAKKRAKRLERERNEWKNKVASLESQLANSAALQLVDPEPVATPEAATGAVAGATPPGRDAPELTPAAPAP